MSTQIAVRLPEEIVEFIDEQVKSGAAPSRAAMVTSALEREMRRRLAQRDADILANIGSDNPGDLDALAEFAASTPLDID